MSQGMRKSAKAFREALKEQGVFYTPDALVKKMRGLLPEHVESVYDPTCGVGGLLAGFDCPRYGAEIDPDEAEKARQAGVIVMTGDTLEENPFSGAAFHAIVASPPFSVSWNPDAHKEDPIFDGWPKLPPKSKADYAFIAHILAHLTEDGTAVVMAYPGILYRGSAEGAIREYLARRGCFERIENVPGGTFDDTSIATVIITLRKGGCKSCTFVEGDRQAVATIEDMAANGFNLSTNTYLPQDAVKEQIDIRAVNLRKTRRGGCEPSRVSQAVPDDLRDSIRTRRTPANERGTEGVSGCAGRAAMTRFLTTCLFLRLFAFLTRFTRGPCRSPFRLIARELGPFLLKYAPFWSPRA